MILINLNNQDKILRYDFNAVSELEEKANMGLFAMLQEENMGYRVIRLLVWAGLRHANRGLTLDIVGIWLNDEVKKGATLEMIINKVMDALKESGLLGKEEEDTKTDNEEGEINPVAK
jgi:hypothetical protein